MQQKSERNTPQKDPLRFDLNQLDLGNSAIPTSVTTQHRTSPDHGFKAFANRALRWVNQHRWVTLIAVLNLISLALAIPFPPALVLSFINLPIGLVIIGLLFAPRLHTVNRLSGACSAAFSGMGAAFARVGAGGVGLIALAVIVKTVPRIAGKAGNNPNLDFSNFNLSSIGVVVGSLLAIVAVITIGLLLWKLIGIARLLAAGYCVQIAMTTLLLIIGIWNGDTVFDRSMSTRNPASDHDQNLLPGSVFRPAQRSPDASPHTFFHGRPPLGPLNSPSPAEDEPTNLNPGLNSVHDSDAINRRIEAFRARHSREHTVVIKITKSDASESPQSVHRRMQMALRPGFHFFGTFGDQCLLLFVDDSPISKIVANLPSGEVQSLAETERTIEFRIESASVTGTPN